MQVFYCDSFVLPLPPGHRFPMEKYSLLRRQLIDSGAVRYDELRLPAAATREHLELAHDPDYVDRMHRGAVPDQQIRALGFPWSPELIERSKRSSGATIGACRAALTEGIAVNLAGGTHHAFRDRGEGFCVFNDSAVAARALQTEGLVRRVVVLDCDVHQGNGTAALLADDPSVFTFSLHGAKNYPLRKEVSDLDVELGDGAGDLEYLEALDKGVAQVFGRIDPDLAIYLAGADPFSGDRFGRLAVSKYGLMERDRLVLNACKAHGLPVAITMAGGYAARVQDTVDIHAQTVALAAEMSRRW